MPRTVSTAKKGAVYFLLRCAAGFHRMDLLGSISCWLENKSIHLSPPVKYIAPAIRMD
jgi:hypothetical protein